VAAERRQSTLTNLYNAAKENTMAGYGKKSKRGGFVGNLAKLGGSSRKLKLAGDMRPENLTNSTFKKASKQAHKKV